MSNISSEDISVLKKRYGYVTLSMLRGNMVKCSFNPMDSLAVVNGRLQSDITSLMHMDAKAVAAYMPLMTPSMAERPYQSCKGIAGTRHISLSQAYNDVKAFDGAARTVIKDTQDKINSSAPAQQNVQPSNNQ